MELEVPAQFGRYRLELKLGKGAFGTVYKAWDTHLEAYVALKLPQLEGLDSQRREHILARFHREAKAAARLPPNSHICAVRDHGEIEGQPYVTMAFIEGRPLSKVRKPQPIRTTIRTVRRIARAMQVAHDNGVIHRDLKPDNIMIVEGDQPVVMDFGLARRMDSDDSLQTVDGTVIGTPAYMSPEQARGVQSEIGPQSDVYGLGVIAYELLTGRRPFEAESVYALLTKIATEMPAPPSRLNPEIGPELDEICLRAIARDRTIRFASMKELDEILEEYSHATRGKKQRSSKPLLESGTPQPQPTTDWTPEELFPATADDSGIDEIEFYSSIDEDLSQTTNASGNLTTQANREASGSGTPMSRQPRRRSTWKKWMAIGFIWPGAIYMIAATVFFTSDRLRSPARRAPTDALDARPFINPAYLESLPGVESIEVTRAKGNRMRQILHIPNWHYVDRESFVADIQTEPGKPLSDAELDQLWQALLEKVESVQTEQEALLRALVEQHGVYRVYLEGVTPDDLERYRELAAALKRHQEPAGDDKMSQFLREQYWHDRLMLGAASRVESLEVLPAEDAQALEAANPVKHGRVTEFDTVANERREDAIVRNVLASDSPVAVIVLGGGHDLSDNVERIGGGSVEYVRVQLKAHRKAAGEHQPLSEIDENKNVPSRTENANPHQGSKSPNNPLFARPYQVMR